MDQTSFADLPNTRSIIAVFVEHDKARLLDARQRFEEQRRKVRLSGKIVIYVKIDLFGESNGRSI